MIAVVLLLFISGANAHHIDDPTRVCQTTVQHNSDGLVRQRGPSPYSIKTLRDEADVLVTITSSIEIPLHGLTLQARIRDGELPGVFEPTKNNAHTINWVQPGDTIILSHQHSKLPVEVRWTPPLGYVGPVTFNATIVQDDAKFWVGVESETVQISKRYQNDETFQEAPRPNPHNISKEKTLSGINSESFYEGCGVRKLCFGTLDGCVSNQDCQAVVAVTVTGDRYEFELKAVDSPAWVGVGLSDDSQMGNDSIIECVKEGAGLVQAYLSWTIPRPNLNAVRISNPQEGIQLLNSSAVDGTLYCNVLRDVKTTINGKEFDLINTKYHILVAAGTTTKENGIAYHDIGRRPSSSSRYLSDVSPFRKYKNHLRFLLLALDNTTIDLKYVFLCKFNGNKQVFFHKFVLCRKYYKNI